MAVASAGSRSRKASLTSTTSIDGKRLVMAEDSIRSQADIDSDLKMIYGDTIMKTNPSPSVVHQPLRHNQQSNTLDTDLLVDKLRSMSHLSTITENSPYSTHMGSRRNSHHPTASAIFDGHETIVESVTDHSSDRGGETREIVVKSANSSDCPYYPMMESSEPSRPFTPRFTGGEELSSNYEPILVTREFAVSPVVGVSPLVPKRSARMELDAINNKRPFSQLEKLPDVPEGRDVDDDDDGGQAEDEEEVFEEIENPEDKIENDAIGSAFDDTLAATFYV